jgi:hypothetical protein
MNNLIRTLNKTQSGFNKTKTSQFSKSSMQKMNQYISIPNVKIDLFRMLFRWP